MASNSGLGHLRQATVRALTHVMQNHNPYARQFQTASEQIAAFPDRVIDLRLLTVDPSNRDSRRYNKPRAREVGMIVSSGAQPAGTSNRDIVLKTHEHHLKRIQEDHPIYLPTRFVLLLPLGSAGWHDNMRVGRLHGFLQRINDEPGSTCSHVSMRIALIVFLSTDRFISLRQWHSFHLHTRIRPTFSPLHHGGLLFQEWTVDAYATTEQRELKYYGKHQNRFRSENFAQLDAAIRDGEPLHRIGVPSVLPASHVGSPRYMKKNYLDAMAIVRHFGKPSLFITMTTNPNWREIQENLLPGQVANDRPDLVARVFELKKKALLNDLFNVGIFGRAIARAWVVEWQKRGLPHVHILVILDPIARPLTTQDIDEICSAELPDPAVSQNLYNTVTNCMLHGPCDQRCIRDGKCKSGYPKRFREQSSSPDDAYPDYRRRENGRTHTDPVTGFTRDNRNVVPHNPYLSAKFDAHINVEIASSISAVKYLFKYVFKGNDRAAFVLREDDEEVDEIQDYLDGRYISPPEACHRIFGYNVSEHAPNVIRLDIHLPGLQRVTFNADEAAEDALINTKSSSLDAFFRYCATNPEDVAGLLYPDAPTRLTWHKDKGVWTKRRSGQAIGRVTWIPPNKREVSGTPFSRSHPLIMRSCITSVSCFTTFLDRFRLRRCARSMDEYTRLTKPHAMRWVCWRMIMSTIPL